LASVKVSNLKLTMIRVTQGSFEPDEQADANIQNVTIPFGIYHALTPQTTGYMQADNFMQAIARYPSAQWYAVDAELDGITAQQLFAFIEVIEAQIGAYQCIIYSNADTFNQLSSAYDAEFAKRRLWVAHWTSAPTPLLPRPWKASKTYWLWQYGKAYVDGIKGKVDVNRFYKPQEGGFLLGKPFSDYQITSRFNTPRNYPFAPDKLQLHEGLDGIGTGLVKCGVYGTVVKIGFDARGYGHFLIIDCGNNWRGWYAHFERIDARLGQFVTVGDVLGVMGSTGGTSTAPHVHITVQHIGYGLRNYVVDWVVDPEDYL